MKKIVLLLTFVLFIVNIIARAEFPDQQFHCNKNNTIYQCSIWTDGYYAIKAKTYNEQPKFEIEDYLFEEIKDGIFDEGNIVVKDGFIKQCKKCNKEQKEQTPFLIHKYIVFNKIPNYKKYIKNNKIDNLEEFNKNGYFLAFRNKNNKNDNKYLFIYKDKDNSWKAVYNNISTFLNIYDDTYSNEHYACYNIDLERMIFEEKQIQIDNQEMFNKLYSLDKKDRITNEDIKKVGNDIVIFNTKKQEKIKNVIKKVNYDFRK